MDQIKVYSIDGITPVVDPTAYVHPSAILIGDVMVGPNCYVGPAACLRGDFGRLILKRGANIQDTCVMHGFPDGETVVEENGHIGHGAILHGCQVGYNAMVGMNAVVMDNVVVGQEAIIAASAFVKAGTQIPPRTLLAGVPGQIVRELSQQEIDWKSEGTALYQDLTKRSLSSMQSVAPLSEPEPNRKRIEMPGVVPLATLKAKQAP